MAINKKYIRLVLLSLLFVTVFVLPGVAQASSEGYYVNIYLFVLEGCTYCAKAEVFLEDLAGSDSRINYFEFEVSQNLENRSLFMEFADAHGFEPQSVPIIFIADEYWVGFSDSMEPEIEAVVRESLETSHRDYGREILPSELFIDQDQTVDPTPAPAEVETQRKITLPLIGTIDLSGQSLLVSTLIISFVDGFNPCSLWVLSILLSITLQSKSRKKVLIVGSTFLIVTAVLYGLFIAGVFSVLRIISFIGWIQVVVALIALGFALVNIKDYFWYKEGVSFTISDDKKPGIYKRMRGVLEHSDSTWRLIGATVVFATGIAMVELSCTAGFPVIWSNLLASQNVEALTFLLLLLVYMIIYLLDEMGIFLITVFTLRSSKMEEKHGRILKLVGGMLMLTLAVVMLVDPTVMNDITSSLIVFGIALVLTGFVLLVHRVILPKFNIKIGTE